MASQIDAPLFKKMFLAGAKYLDEKKEWINELNVFPVPDGDTGTNMTLTIMSAAKEVQALPEENFKTLAKAVSSGSLRGARGNSGVILSQLCRGFCKEIQDAEAITTTVLANAFQRATETAYKAVMKPKEGTILTVARGMAEKATILVNEEEDIAVFMEKIIEEGNAVLKRTPELLPVLKQAGVVDSGGQGLMVVMQGAYDAFMGKEVELNLEVPSSKAVSGGQSVSSGMLDTSDIKFGYCTEFIINLEKSFGQKEENSFKGFLESIGDSIVCVADEDMVKVHVHTNHPGQAIERALTFGSLSRMKIDNMREEHEEKLIKEAAKLAAEQSAEKKKAEEPRKEAGFIAVSIGEGLNEIFRDLNVDYIIEGGQTMNPSTEDMLNAIDAVNADTVYILPNNKNIILAAEQAKGLTEDKTVVVVPSKTVPQGITAVISYMAGKSPEENLETMQEEMSRVKTGQITYAVRNTTIDDVEIKEGDIMGLGDSGILAVGNNIEDTAFEMIGKMVDEDCEIITLYYGADTQEEKAEALYKRVADHYPDCDVEMQSGGQPIYYYLISAE